MATNLTERKTLRPTLCRDANTKQAFLWPINIERPISLPGTWAELPSLLYKLAGFCHRQMALSTHDPAPTVAFQVRPNERDCFSKQDLFNEPCHSESSAKPGEEPAFPLGLHSAIHEEWFGSSFRWYRSRSTNTDILVM